MVRSFLDRLHHFSYTLPGNGALDSFVSDCAKRKFRMPIQLASPPGNAYQLIAQAVSRLSTVGGSAERVTSVNDPSKLGAALPHMVYVMRNDAIAQGRNVGDASLVAWRFLIQYGTQTLGAIELSCDSRGQNLRFASLDTGPFAQG